VRPVVTWRNAPAYKLAGLFISEIRRLAPLPNTHNISNITDLKNKLKDTPTLPHYGLASLEIANLYTNVPVKDARDIISNTLEQLQLNPQTRHELQEWYDVITLHNYFSKKWTDNDPERRTRHGRPNIEPLGRIFLTTSRTTPHTLTVRQT